ncbi:hypothetical protein BKA62DRAFT_721849 [Auriculariales sp. MPI-PUGE-AT-0066]|nr:hypothetical protein BKA62DRAFT_721849 [Auriculariales sp. MPI-PUGE-AT-0066]
MHHIFARSAPDARLSPTRHFLLALAALVPMPHSDSQHRTKKRGGSPVLRLGDAIRTALEAECAERAFSESLLSRPAVLVEAIAHLKTVFDHAVAAFVEDWNTRSVTAFAQLAPELLTSVFMFLDLKDRIAASHVCRAWRNGSLAAPGALWSHVVSHSQGKDVLAARIARVPVEVPFLLSVWVTNDNWREVARALDDNIHRLRSLWLRMDELLEEDAQVAIRRALAHPAPLLEGIRILDGKSNLKLAGSSPSIPFVGVLPLLSLVKYYGQLSVFETFPKTIDRVMFSQPGTTTIDHFTTLATRFTESIALSIELDAWEVPAANTPRVVFSERLETLFLGQNDRSIDFPNVLAHIAHCELKNVAVNFREHNGEDGATKVFEAIVVATAPNHEGRGINGCHVIRMDVLNLAKQDSELDLYLSVGRRRYFSSVPMKWSTAHMHISYLRHLRITESLLGLVLKESGPYYLARIERLDIVLTPPTMMCRDATLDNLLWMLPRRVGYWLLGPALHTLGFVASYAQPTPSQKDAPTLRRAFASIRHTTTIDPYMLREFLGWHLDCPLGQLRVVLQDVDLVTHDVPAVARMLADLEDLLLERPSLNDRRASPFNELHGWDSDTRFPFLDQLG